MSYAPFRRCTPGIATRFSRDLHVLGTPPTFVLSQDQTLRSNKSHQLIGAFTGTDVLTRDHLDAKARRPEV